MLRESAGARVSRQMARRGLVLLAAMGLLVSACGSGDEQPSSESSTAPGNTEATAPVAGAQENAVTSGAVCYSWPNGTMDAQPCAVGLKGPGGGRVFYDAGSVQPWGRFLEVAPQMWGPRGYDCRWCGAADGVPRYTTDENGAKQGYYLCRTGSHYGADRVLLPGEAGKTDEAIGAGRGNTEVLSKTAECVDGSTSALTLATGYQGYGGLSDWYLPSVQELTALCKYEGRSAIGGFLGSDVKGTNPYYHSSTVGPKGDYTVFYGVDFGGNPATCSRQEMLFDENQNYHGFVRPIRAFA